MRQLVGQHKGCLIVEPHGLVINNFSSVLVYLRGFGLLHCIRGKLTVLTVVFSAF